MSNEKQWPLASTELCVVQVFIIFFLLSHLPAQHLDPSWRWHLTNNMGPTHITLVTAICSVHWRFYVFRPLYMAWQKYLENQYDELVKTDTRLMDVAQPWHGCGVKFMFMWLAEARGHCVTVYLPLMDTYWLGLIRTIVLYCVTLGVSGLHYDLQINSASAAH